MDGIVGFQSPIAKTIRDKNLSVLASVRSIIVRAYQQQKLTNVTLDIGAIGGIRALAAPFDLRKITNFVIRSLLSEGFRVCKMDSLSPHHVFVEWGSVLRSMQRAKRKRHSRSTLEYQSRDKLKRKHYESATERCAATKTDDGTWHFDITGTVPRLDMLANPQKLKRCHIDDGVTAE